MTTAAARRLAAAYDRYRSLAAILDRGSAAGDGGDPARDALTEAITTGADELTAIIATATGEGDPDGPPFRAEPRNGSGTRPGPTHARTPTHTHARAEDARVVRK